MFLYPFLISFRNFQVKKLLTENSIFFIANLVFIANQRFVTKFIIFERNYDKNCVIYNFCKKESFDFLF